MARTKQKLKAISHAKTAPINVDESLVSGPTVEDPQLREDVSQFLADLKSSKTRSHTIKGKEKSQPERTFHEKPRKPVNKDKKSLPPKTELSPSNLAPNEQPKVQIPTKLNLNPKSSFKFQPLPQWHTALPPLSPAPSSTTKISPVQLSTLTAKAADLHEKDISTFQASSSSNSSSSEASFLAKIIHSGTLSDRLSALTLLTLSSPLHNTKALETLRGMAERGKGKGGREESLKALRCIVDWWVGGGAPGRKLKYFRDQPLLHPDVTDEHLIVWYFEDWLKKYFFSILQILETLASDSLQYVRTQTISLIFSLLRDKPEQEQNLLRLLVNKLGDTEKALASRASYHILQLVQTHPAMKSVIVREIISLVLRPPAAPATSSSFAPNKHIRFGDGESSTAKAPKTSSKPAEKTPGNAHARYYATVTFNQIVLTPADRDVALQLMDAYFEMFKELLGEGSGVATEDMNEKDDKDPKEYKTDKGGRIRDDAKRKGKQKEVKGAAGFTEVEDSSSKLVSAILTGVNRALPFAKINATDAGINKHIDTLFLITHTSTFNISLQALVLIQHVTTSFSTSTPSTSTTAKSVIDRYYRTLYASLHDPRLASSSKQAMYLNLFFKSVKADVGRENGERLKALIRRFIQVLVSGGGVATEFIAGGLFLLGELFSSIPGLRSMINDQPKDSSDPYDPKKREPQFAHASTLPLWELTVLRNHFHPAVALHARQLLSSQPLTASADLSQNTISHFLDRFVYKNPKKLKDGETTGKGASAMQPAGSAIEGVKLIKGEIASNQTLVNEPAFLKRNPRDIPVDQMFFHRYFTRKDEREKAKASKVKKRKEGKEDSEEEEEEEEEVEEEEEKVEENHELEKEDEEDSDAEEAEIWKAMKSTMPILSGDDDLMDDGSDMDDDDLPSDLGGNDLDEDDADSQNDENETENEKDEDEDEDILSLVEGSDNDDLVSLGGDIPEGLIEYDGPDFNDAVEEEIWDGVSSSNNDKKRKREDTASGRRKKLRSLPTFASYEDYAKLIEEGPEDDI